MAKYVIDDTTLTDIADAIRSKTDGTEPIAVTDMAEQIGGITTEPAVEEYDGTVRDVEPTTLTSSDGYVIADSNGVIIKMLEA